MVAIDLQAVCILHPYMSLCSVDIELSGAVCCSSANLIAFGPFLYSALIVRTGTVLTFLMSSKDVIM